MTRSDRLLILSSEFAPRRGGIGTYAREMATAATELGYEVTVAAVNYGADQRLVDASLPFEVIRFPGKPHTMRQLPAKISFVRSLAKSRKDFDIVHAADWPFYIPLALSRYRRSARCILTFHGTEVNFMQSPKRALFLRCLGFWNGWAENVANSHYTAEALTRAFNLQAGSVKAIGLGVSKSWLETPPDRAQSRTNRGYSTERFVISSLGRIVPRKGHLILADALSILPEELARRITWQIIGPAVDVDYASRVARRMEGSAIDTRILGSLPDSEVKECLAASDLFCLPGFIDSTGAVEGFGLVYLEAGAMGLPSIGTTAGGVPDAVKDGITGLLVPPNSVEAVASSLKKLMTDPDLLAQLANKAQAHAEASTWSSVVKATYQGSQI